MIRRSICPFFVAWAILNSNIKNYCDQFLVAPTGTSERAPLANGYECWPMMRGRPEARLIINLRKEKNHKAGI